MLKKFLAILFVLSISILPACARKGTAEDIITPMTQLEKRQFQTRTYETIDKPLVMKAMLNVLQDEGFIVYNANPLLGFIYGVKDFDTADKNIDISKEFGLSKSRLSLNGIRVATIETTANVTEYGKSMRVRVNFKRKLLNVYGNAQFIDDVNDENYYQDFFSKVDKAIFLQKQKI
ncbi:MAG: hypothetical protein NC191_08355 [Muribaculaceae bacterium]|nr:hypothetical protein [Muribaculaceae bacterium]